MSGHDIIVIGASAGGVEALSRVVTDLPADLPVSVFIVLHIPPTQSALPLILDRRSKLPVAHAVDGEAIKPGRIYVAPPDRHLLVMRDRVRVAAGPRENGYRPAVDPLFRSAAVAYGRRVVAVVLSGSLDDGTAGLRAVKSQGGMAVVQDPDEALYPGMPLHAVEGSHPDLILPVAEIGKALAELAESAPNAPEDGGDPLSDEIEAELEWAHPDLESEGSDPPLGRPSGFTGPECHGALWELKDGQLIRFRCRVGHGFSSESLVAVQSNAVEAAIWTAFRALEERAALCRKLAGRATDRQHRHSARHFESHAADAERRAELLRGVLLSGGSALGTPDAGEVDPGSEALPGG